jgi:hypothetical protein
MNDPTLVVAAGGGVHPLVADLGLCLVAAGLLTVAFLRLRIPVIAALLGAGVLLGPAGLEAVSDRASVDTIATPRPDAAAVRHRAGGERQEPAGQRSHAGGDRLAAGAADARGGLRRVAAAGPDRLDLARRRVPGALPRRGVRVLVDAAGGQVPARAAADRLHRRAAVRGPAHLPGHLGHRLPGAAAELRRSVDRADPVDVPRHRHRRRAGDGGGALRAAARVPPRGPARRSWS